MSLTHTAPPPAAPAPSASDAAVIRFARADSAVKGHRGTRAGEDYDRKIAEWRSAYGALLRLAQTLTQERPTNDA